MSGTGPPTSIAEHYDAGYFQWQSAIGLLSGGLNAEKFSPYIKPTDSILDFGCGGGFLLMSLNAAKKTGVEINPYARAIAQKNGLHVVPDLSQVPDGSIDTLISNHALEHTPAPLEVVQAFHSKLKPGGRAVVVVPCERYDTAYIEGNIDQHLYTWSPVNLGNLFRHAGFRVDEVKRIPHRWPPAVDKIDKIFGRTVCNLVCRLYAYARPKLTQVGIVATRP